MAVTLQNECLQVAIETAGAQLLTVEDSQGTQFIWQGDERIWPRRAPLLFPVIGRLYNGSYTLDGQTWQMANHGFCRSAPFTVTEHTDTMARFVFSDTPETREHYPYAFRLTVTYTLQGRSLIKNHLVENLSPTDMYYELGGHDGYRVPLREGESGDYAIVIPGLEELYPYGMDSENIITKKDKRFPLTNGRIATRPSVYGLDTIILDDLPKRQAILVDADNRPRITVDFEDFPYLGLWTANKDFPTGYVCIEPWTTLPDARFVGRGLPDKQGICLLETCQSDQHRYTTTFLG